ncbi:GFA family protein [Mesorhizobium sp. RP14(2022)]|uniref:GFA family protein n=1 Tax=Mesorhizobium liriopis TaxID=2953882 RepID=A0ABT1C5J2_9HYPH|nr:GFA family protein [Mesorhizobium liriopis]MCO6049426.1 GFA family protein [Mesorhizobium liriopis]
MTHHGSCRCGAVRAEAQTAPFWRSYCHCRDCRKQSGAPVMAFVGFREEDLRWTGAAPQTWRNGQVERAFCGQCGSQIAYRDRKLPGEVYLSLGFMDLPEAYPPTLHAFATRALPFLSIADDLPRYDGFSIER